MTDTPYEPPSTKPDDEYIISDLETLRVMADPLRRKILDAMVERVCTVKQIAADLNLPPTKLYYHFKQLEEHGLIRVVDTRLVSGIVEKLYQARAYTYRVDKGLLSPGTPEGDRHLNVMLSATFDDIRDDIRQSIEAGVIQFSKPDANDLSNYRSLVIGRGLSHMSPERAQAFYQRLSNLMKEFGEDEADDENEQAYVMVVAFYPTVRAQAQDADATSRNS
jgi:DNA-binding transcriptional ArsR family regulator